MSTDPHNALRLVTAALDALDIPYLVSGSVASSVHGVVRTTNDADLVVKMNAAKALDLVKALGSAFYADPDTAARAAARRGSFNVIHLGTMFKVDLFVARGTAFDRSRFERRQRIAIDEEGLTEVDVASAEDTILGKLRWYSDGGCSSDRQWNDILGMIAVQGLALERQYLTSWARELGLEELMARALAESA